MGIQLVMEAMETPLGLSGAHAARATLYVMARWAVDDASPPIYFGGWRKIAAALELYPAADGRSDPNQPVRHSVMRHLRTLADLGLIKRVSRVDDQSNRLTATWVLCRDEWTRLRLNAQGEQARALAVENLANGPV